MSVIASIGNGSILLDLLVIFFWVIWFWLLITVFSDLFRDHSLSGFAKVLWIIFVVLVPYLGVFIYLIARGHGMQGFHSITEAEIATGVWRQVSTH